MTTATNRVLDVILTKTYSELELDLEACKKLARSHRSFDPAMTDTFDANADAIEAELERRIMDRQEMSWTRG